MAPAVAAVPTVLEVQVASGSDDAEEDTSGSVGRTSSDLELIQETTAQVIGIRLVGVSVPAGALISGAYLQFTADETSSGPVDLVIHGQAAANPLTFASDTHDISSRPRTASNTTWSPPAWTIVGDAGLAQRTDDLSAVVQELVNQPGWTSGNPMAFIITGSGVRTAESFNGVAASAPLLHVEYSDTGNTAPSVSIASPADGSNFAMSDDITFSATATDAEDGDISNSTNWSSSRDGALGAGSSITTALSVGLQVVTATSTDSGGLQSNHSVAVQVTSSDPILVGAGDISECSRQSDTATAALILDIPDATVFTTGDNVYESGTHQEFADCYDATWGQFKDRTRPSPGNHDYRTPDASGYYGYFDASAGDPATGYYSYDLGGWHVIVLNSNCGEVSGCGRTSPQGQWLAADLAASPARCTIAYWHHPRFSSGSSHGPNTDYIDFWDLLQEDGVSVAVTGHDHHYERFARQDSAGIPDPTGIRQFVAGTGGRVLTTLGASQPNSEVTNDATNGVLMFILRDGSYVWEFRSTPNGEVLDSGSEPCVPRVCPTEATPFTDVSSTSFAAADIACIFGLKITTGTSATTYSPADNITREQAAAFLARLWRIA